MKQLKPSTIKRYSVKQLINHLESCLDKFETAPFRVCSGPFNSNSIFIYCYSSNAYYFYCDASDKEDIIEVLNSTYKQA